MRVLVTGARLPAALEIARALDARGIEVFAADTVRFGFTTHSRSVQKYFRIPSPVLDFKAFGSAVTILVNDLKIDLVIPVSEEVFFLAKLPIPLFAPDFDLLTKLHSKVRIQEMTPLVPPTCVVQNETELRHFGEAVVKQEFSRGAIKAHIKPVDLSRIQFPAVAQKFVAGREVCTYSVAHAGRLFTHACYEPIYRYGFGASVYFRSVSEVKVLKFVEDFVARTRYTGQIAFDIILANDQMSVLECNPRATSGVHLLTGDQIADALLGNGSLTVAPAGVSRSAKLTLLMTNFVSPIDFLRARDTSFRWSDPLPFFLQFVSVFELMKRARKWKMSAGAAFGYDIEWNGEPFE